MDRGKGRCRLKHNLSIGSLRKGKHKMGGGGAEIVETKSTKKQEMAENKI